MDQIKKTFGLIKRAMDTGKRCKMDEVEKILKDIHIKLLSTPFFTKNQRSMSVEDLSLCVSILEYICKCYVQLYKPDKFMSAFEKLKASYVNLIDVIPRSENLEIVISFYLMFLIVYEKFYEYQNELFYFEKLFGEEFAQHECIRYVSAIGQASEGNSFLKLVDLLQKPPIPLFTHVTESVIDGNRTKCIKLIQNSYLSLTVDELTKLLRYPSRDVCMKLIKEKVDNKEWCYDPASGVISFDHKDTSELFKKGSMEHSLKLALQVKMLN